MTKVSTGYKNKSHKGLESLVHGPDRNIIIEKLNKHEGAYFKYVFLPSLYKRGVMD
jgi:hypothetical protein